MNYVSTRDKNNKVSSAEAIAHGISKEGGLFVPESFPKFSGEDFENLKKLDYIGRAKYVLKSFLTDFTEEELDYCVNGAYTGSFDEDKPAPLTESKIDELFSNFWAVAENFRHQYCGLQEILSAEKNASTPEPNGTLETGVAIAKDVQS